MPGSRLVRVWRWGIRLLAVAYLIGLLAAIAGMRWVGDAWWPTIALLYLPRWGFALPLPFLTGALLIDRAWRWLLTQLVALALVVFLMGPHLSLSRSGARAATAGLPSFKVVTFNINGARAGLDNIAAHLRSVAPDVIALQEAGHEDAGAWRERLPGYQVEKSGQFVLASRFPIEDRFEPPPITHDGRQRTRRFQRYRIATPGGSIYLYNVHPISPREAFDDLRGEGLGHEIASGRVLRPATDEVTSAAALRAQQLEAVVDDAARSTLPVIIAGDTNLPEQSRTLARVFKDYRDAFADVGSGFGYTFPLRKGGPWMRIDRIFAGPRLRFLDARVIPGKVSDHLPVIATVQPVPPAR
jgi:endonuclease/exonuclease/phosphatase (EEP) superfamily protein YafD